MTARPHDAIVWDTLKPETGSYIDPKLADSHSDLLFSVRLRNGHDVLVYALLEHQSTQGPDDAPARPRIPTTDLESLS
jgi:hypothetical protein